jgi:hypothetical protein
MNLTEYQFIMNNKMGTKSFERFLFDQMPENYVTQRVSFSG